MTDLRARIGYCERTEKRPYFYANAHEKDFVPLAPVEVDIADARGRDCSLDVEGFTLIEHESALADLTDLAEVKRVHSGEIAEMLTGLLGCDHVAMAPMGILRFSERAGANAVHDNSHPARFVHVDMAKEAAAGARMQTAPEGCTIVRSAQYNVWRVLSSPPQDVPLGLCDYTSLDTGDLIDCDAIFDPLDGSPEWGFPNYLLAYNPAHRWFYYANMHPAEALVFKTSESDPERAQMMPHGAFDNPLAPKDAVPRISLEMRGTAYWFG
ncbi:CmcJ/NvfI family oxidoreductase [Aurantiacibacter poecillastricola]|uniref:CmcJ/NvfI family oxidoreductase n=1 Tax=Aurantiacibacter poecillastricola TaxID=3064385 RepID=UPI00273ED63F|nr:CmcJ/NvfI family oxidoreductase [Aurantiacibacter sp. 219JJ12-13]MDP5260874.1 CmcJ/NvfI family oxidoreductase [Aurantiacibacter sp. 219JJ12-13]